MKANITFGEKKVESMFNDAIKEPTRYMKFLRGTLSDNEILILWKALNVVKNASNNGLFDFKEASGCITDGSSNVWDLACDFEESLTEHYLEDED